MTDGVLEQLQKKVESVEATLEKTAETIASAPTGEHSQEDLQAWRNAADKELAELRKTLAALATEISEKSRALSQAQPQEAEKVQAETAELNRRTAAMLEHLEEVIGVIAEAELVEPETSAPAPASPGSAPDGAPAKPGESADLTKTETRAQRKGIRFL